MTDETVYTVVPHCKNGACLPKNYDGIYRCMICYKEFNVATEEEEVMNYATAQPALARIQELETENTSLREKLEALKAIVSAPRNPEKEGCQRNVEPAKYQHDIT